MDVFDETHVVMIRDRDPIEPRCNALGYESVRPCRMTSFSIRGAAREVRNSGPLRIPRSVDL